MEIRQENVTGDIGSVPRCKTCGSERVVKDAWVCWDSELARWELANVHTQVFCQNCEAASELIWSRPEPSQKNRIRELNDRFRCKGIGRGSIMLTQGIQEKGGDFAVAAVKAVREFDAFSGDNDPWGEHDFGAIEVNGEKVFFKIDYYDLSLQQGSEDPANEEYTCRILTIMLASEY